MKAEFHGIKVTCDAGLLAYRELDEALGFTTSCDNRTGKNTQHSVAALLRQSIYGRPAGYDDTNDVERLSVDSAMRLVVGGRAKERTIALTTLMGRFETEILIQPMNFEILMNLPGIWVDQAYHNRVLKDIILDMDILVNPTWFSDGDNSCAL